MSNTFTLVCDETKLYLWVGQGHGHDMTNLYDGGKYSDNLRRFLNHHLGKSIRLICDLSEDPDDPENVFRKCKDFPEVFGESKAESLPQPWSEESEAGIKRLIEERDRARELAVKKTAEAEDNLVRAVLAERENARLRNLPDLTEDQLMDFSLDLGEQECYQLGYNKARSIFGKATP